MFSQGQNLEHQWSFQRISTPNNDSLFAIDQAVDKLELESGLFSYSLLAKNIENASGDYVYQHPLLVFFYNSPTDTIRRYRVKTLTETQLVFTEGAVSYHFSRAGPKVSEQTELSSTTAERKKMSISLESIGRGLIGMVFLLLVAYLLSSNRRAINWKLVLTGLSLQLAFAVLVLQVDVVSDAFDWLSDKIVKFLNFSEEGAEFLFGGLVTNEDTFGYIFAFRVLPTIVFFSAFTALMYYLGILQVVVKAFAWVMSKTMGLSGAESLAAAANIFIGQTEAPLVVKPYLESMTRSEILCLMVGGMATIAGSVLAAFIAFLGGDSDVEKVLFAKHLLTASIMSAPAAIIMAKMLYPETEEVNKKLDISKEQVGSNLLDALSRGTTDGLKLAVNVGAMLLVFTAIMAVLNWITEDGIGNLTGLNAIIAENTDGRYSGLSMQYLLGNLFAPIAWLIGVPAEDITTVGQLLGEKTILNEFYAYATLSELKQSGVLTNYRSVVIATYALCGFANFASIGIQIGGIGVLAPSQRTNLARFGFKALIGGTAAALLTATIVGMIIG
ncbi:NupC/NupG family nucleoside CNT transporter [Aureitalea marina]|nr:nucleoside transporter C-terminal domain-containing protein [Aureitalea marina]